MRAAFKEWAVIVDALGRGDQCLVLRKGGLREGAGGFHLASDRFWLFPTRFHQQREAVLPAAQARFDILAAQFPPADQVVLEYFAEVADARKVQSPAALDALRGRHCWRDEVIAQRYNWGGEQAIFALCLRVFRLAQAVRLPMLPAYGGCQSWIELGVEVPVTDALPVLSAAAFPDELTAFAKALPAEPAAATVTA